MNKGLRFGLAAAAFAVVAGTALIADAQAPQIAARQEVMKQQAGANRVIVPMVRGEQPFNMAAAKQAANTLVMTSKQIPGAFGPGTEGGNALPAIWQNKADFDAKAKNLEDAATRLAAANDEAAFKAAFPAVGQACGGCHQPYRKPAS
jgi:cytochrome c556